MNEAQRAKWRCSPFRIALSSPPVSGQGVGQKVVGSEGLALADAEAPSPAPNSATVQAPGSVAHGAPYAGPATAAEGPQTGVAHPALCGFSTRLDRGTCCNSHYTNRNGSFYQFGICGDFDVTSSGYCPSCCSLG